MSNVPEIWMTIAGFSRVSELRALMLVDQLRSVVAEEIFYTSLDLRYNSYGDVAPVEPQRARDLFEMLASPRGASRARRVQLLDAIWIPEGGSFSVTQLLCDALAAMSSLRALCICASADYNMIENALQSNTWTRLRQAYFDGATVPTCFLRRHWRLQRFRSNFGILRAGDHEAVSLPDVREVSVTSTDEADLLFMQIRPLIRRVDFMLQDEPVCNMIGRIIPQCPALDEINFSWIHHFSAADLSQFVSEQQRCSVLRVGVWVDPQGHLEDFGGPCAVVTELAAAFPRMQILRIRYLFSNVIEWALLLTLSEEIQGLFAHAVTDSLTLLPHLRSVEFGRARGMIHSGTTEPLRLHTLRNAEQVDHMDDAW